ncbi:MAG: hypothetical protein LBF71_02715 [Campylobacteraceae bacterium]|nr:hypothetical protein [Campylobacteraceae bacterium]
MKLKLTKKARKQLMEMELTKVQSVYRKDSFMVTADGKEWVIEGNKIIGVYPMYRPIMIVDDIEKRVDSKLLDKWAKIFKDFKHERHL